MSWVAWASTAWLVAEPAALQFEARREVELGAAAAVRVALMVPRLHGVEVRGAARMVPEGPRGFEAPAVSVGAPQVEPSEAVVLAEEVAERVAVALDLEAEPVLESAPTLVYLLRLGQPVLAWEAQLPLTLHPVPSRRTVWISAMTGRLLGEEEQVKQARARVFAENPSSTPEAIDVELPRLGTVAPGSPLVSPSIAAFNCVAEAPDEVAPWVREGDCHPEHRVFADEDGNFYPYTPNVILEADNVEPEDGYAELSMYYHGARFLDALAQRGIDMFACTQAAMLANVRNLSVDGGSDQPVDNAFYTNQCDPERGPTMMFGQGSQVDFAYDGDVVYHELGHGVVAMLTPEGLGGRRLRDDGVLVDAGGMNEAVADYMAYMMTDDPRVGEYVGRFWASNTRAEIRTGENGKRCPDNTIGQVHNDGEPFAGALWSTRVAVGPAIDDLVLRTLPRLARDASLEDGAAALLEVAGEMRDERVLTDDDVAHLERALATRGLLDCPRVITDPDAVRAGRSMHLRRSNATVQPFFPGPMQLRAQVPAGATALEVHFGVRGDDEPEDRVAVLVKRSEQRIAFSYTLVALDDPGDATGETGRIREVTHTEGDWELELEPTEQPDGDFVARIVGVHEGEVVHVALAARGPSDLVATSVAIHPIGAHDDPVDTEGATDSEGDDEDAGANDASVSAQATSAGGCGCHAGSDSSMLLGWWILPLMLRRRRTRRHAAP